MAPARRALPRCAHAPDGPDRGRPPELPRDRPRAARGGGLRGRRRGRRTAPRRSRRPPRFAPTSSCSTSSFPISTGSRSPRGLLRRRRRAGGDPRLEPRRERLRRPDRRLRRPRLRREGRPLRRSRALDPRLSRRAFAVAIVVAVIEAAAATWLDLHERLRAEQGRHRRRRGHRRRARSSRAGLIAIRRRPENRTGLYLASVGYLWLLERAARGEQRRRLHGRASCSATSRSSRSRCSCSAFPTGRLTTRIDRVLVRWTVWFVILGPLLMELVSRQPPGCSDHRCRDSAILVYDSHFLGALVDWVATASTLALILCVVVVLVRRWRAREQGAPPHPHARLRRRCRRAARRCS